MNQIESLIKEGVIELGIYKTTPTHSGIYGLKASNPLYVQRIFIQEEYRRKGLGVDVLKYIDDFANENNHDLIFGHVSHTVEPSVDFVKLFLKNDGYCIIEDNNDFYKRKHI